MVQTDVPNPITSPRLGILGAGQLARMLGFAAQNLGIGCRFYETHADAPAAAAGVVVAGTFDDIAALTRFADGLDTVTYEWENVPVDAARAIARTVAVHPAPRALEVGQDRISEKQFFRSIGMDVAEHAAVDSRAELDAAIAEIGLPAILKTRRLGYDGKGQVSLMTADDAGTAWQTLGGTPLILERRLPLDCELSIIGVRGRDGSIAHYPLAENVHRDGILHVSTAPAADVEEATAARAREWMERMLTELDYVGVLALELFVVDGRLVANEMAPRVHNSGHWSIEGATTSQFENHVRAVLGLPLGSTEPRGFSCMVNIIGELPGTGAVLAVPGAHLHLYGKTPRPGRKLGHVTVTADSRAGMEERRRALLIAMGLADGAG